MSFIPKDAIQYGWNLSWRPKAPSTAISNYAILKMNGSGQLTPAGATDHVFHGISIFASVASDADYAVATLEPYLDLTTLANDTTVIATLSATGSAANEDTAYDLSNSVTVNIGASAVKAFLLTKWISANLAEGRILNPTLL